MFSKISLIAVVLTAISIMSLTATVSADDTISPMKIKKVELNTIDNDIYEVSPETLTRLEKMGENFGEYINTTTEPATEPTTTATTTEAATTM